MMDDAIELTTIEPQLTVIEDESIIAQEMVKKLPITRSVLNKVSYLTEIEQLATHPSLNDARSVFWIDIHLGTGKEKDGLKMIKLIRERNKSAYIIVYTGHATKRETLQAGANLFFRKNASNVEEDVMTINSNIEKFLLKDIAISKALTTRYAEIENIDRKTGIVKLLYHFENGTEEGEVDLDSLGDIDRLSIDTLIKVTIFRHSSGYRVNFEETAELPYRKTEPGHPGEKNIDLENSGIWTNNLQP